MKIRLIGIGFVVFILAVGLLFYRLGGMKKPFISQAVSASYVIAGKSYHGKTYDNHHAFQTFQSDLNADRDLFLGNFILIYDQNPNQASDAFITVFGGFVVTDTINIPDGYTIKRLSEQNIIKAEIISHPLVAPSAVQVEEAIKKFAQERNLELDRGLIEEYVRDQSKLITTVAIRN